MIENMEKFKKQCEEYEEFIENIEQITKDYCLLNGKENPLRNYSMYDHENITFCINESSIRIKWTEEEYSCGSSTTEYYDLEIPLDFYEKSDEYQLEKKQKEEDIEKLKKERITLTRELNSVQGKKTKIYQDQIKSESLEREYNITIDKKSFNIKEKTLNKEIKVINDKILKINKKIKELEG